MTKSNGASEGFKNAQRLAEVRVINSSNPTLERSMMITSPKTRGKAPLMKRLFRWLVPDQRIANRHVMPPLVAYLGQACSSKEYKVGDISVAGFYMITEDHWIPGTGFPVTLERRDPEYDGLTLTLYATVVRVGADGVGFTFLQAASEDHSDLQLREGTRVDLSRLAQFLKGLPLSEPEALERAS